MIVQGLQSEEQVLFDQILSNNIGILESELVKSENPVKLAKNLLAQLLTIVQSIGKVWNAEHDLQGKLQSTRETISIENISNFYSNCKPLFELIRSRLPILRSEKKIAIGTLVNTHTISEVLELQLREKGYLTYYWGTSLTLKEIKDKQDLSPANVFVFSCMGVNRELNCFEELGKIRETYPDLTIIVGGPAFPIFLLLKENKEHTALTEPYKNPIYETEINQALNLKEFVRKVFQVEYCESIDEITTILEN